MALLLIPALLLFGTAMVLLVLAIAGAILTLALRILTTILWVAVKILEHRKSEPEIIIVERPMRDVTSRKAQAD